MGYTSSASRTATGAVLIDEDALMFAHKPRAPLLRSTGSRPGATDNGVTRYARLRRRVSAKQSEPTGFFVDDGNHEQLSPSMVVLGSDGNVITGSASRSGPLRRTTPTARTGSTTTTTECGSSPPVATRTQRSSSLPSQLRGGLQQQPSTPPTSARSTEPSKMSKALKAVAFRNVYEPEIMPDRRPTVQSYDELFFNVAGLYHTLSFLHDPDYLDDADASSDSPADSRDRQAQLERSMQLMIAEFLYRSAVFLGYPPDDNVWLPGFRQDKKFSANDVQRWRRLAHFDWAKEEAAFERERAQLEAKEQQQAQLQQRPRASSAGVRATMNYWLNRRRRANNTRDAATTATASSSLPADKPLPPLDLDPAPVPSTVDLARLVEIANACVSYGAFQFSERQIRKLCNVPIKR